MNIVIFLSFITSLLPCLLSWLKMKRQFSEPILFLCCGMSLYSLAYLYGFILRVLSYFGVITLQLQETFLMAGLMGCGSVSFDMITLGCTCVLVFVNICLGLIVWKSKSPITFCLIFVIALMSIFSILAVFVTGSNPLVNFFIECCGIMAYFGWLLELTYKECCVLGNIYLQALILLVAAMSPLCLCLREKRGVLCAVFCSINFLIHGVLFAIICQHYWMPLEDGFNLCFDELNHAASFSGLSYEAVNIVIFVILFVADLLYNTIVYQVVAKTNKVMMRR